MKRVKLSYEQKKDMRRMELDFVVKINNQWSYKAYKYSKKNTSIKIMSYAAVIISILFSQWSTIQMIIEEFI